MERGVDREKSRVDRIAQKDGNTGSPWKRVYEGLASKTETVSWRKKGAATWPSSGNPGGSQEERRKIQQKIGSQVNGTMPFSRKRSV